MPGPKRINRAAINGRAIFCGAAFLVGIGLTWVAERVGAPEGAVRALGGTFALPALALIGLLARSSSLAHFFAGNRAVPQFYGGLAFAGAAAGLGVCLFAPASASPLPLTGVALGLGFGALLFGPAVRRANASALSDFLTIRLGAGPLRWPLGIVLLSTGALVALAGYEAALEALVERHVLARSTGILVVGATLALIVSPGGLASVLWSAAACAGALLLALALPFIAQALAAPGDPFAWLGAGGFGELASSVSSAPPALVLASAIGVGALALWAQPGVAAQNGLNALRAGAAGVLLAGVAGMGAIAGALAMRGEAGPAVNGVVAGVEALAAIALAGCGLFSAVRAFSSATDARISATRALASQRLARARGAALILVGLGGALLRWRAFDPQDALAAAVSLSLAFVAPVLGLTFSARATGAHGLACFLVSLAALLALGASGGMPLAPAGWLADALIAAALGFAAGWTASLFAPTPAPVKPDGVRDAYFELSDGPRP